MNAERSPFVLILEIMEDLQGEGVIEWGMRSSGWVRIDVRSKSGQLRSSCRRLDSHQVKMKVVGGPMRAPKVDEAA